ncbi:helix-turn-helix domain-containing protein [Microbacterium sp. F2]|uniref:helix-turn-helix domain-containing protein n=1 Tax=Microbacterium sp. F2 TaxID=3422228 RepID=UPI003FCF8ED0
MTNALATRPSQPRSVVPESVVPATTPWSEPVRARFVECDWSPFVESQYYVGCVNGTGGFLTDHLIKMVSSRRTGSRVRVVVGGVESPVVKPNAPISSMVNRIRLAFGLSVTDLAAVLGVERPTIYSWLKDGSTPAPARLARVQQVLALADTWSELGVGRNTPTLTSEVAPGVDLRSALREAHLWGAEIDLNLREQAAAGPVDETRSEGLLVLAEELGLAARPEGEFDIATGRPLAPEL